MVSRHATDAPIAALVPAADSDAAVASIGHYTIVERIGQGGIAEIYAAVTQGEGSFRRPVVIKRLRPELTVDPNAVAQFCDEANLLAALHHPNIVAVQLRPLAGPIFPRRGICRRAQSGPRRRAPFRAGAPAAPGRGHRLRRRRAAEGAGVRARPDQRDGTAARDGAPRHLARKRDGVGAGRGEAAGLRRGQGVRRARRAHRNGRREGQRDLHGPRASARPGRRFAGRSVFAGAGAVHAGQRASRSTARTPPTPS